MKYLFVLRNQAEETDDPELYEQAAAEFETVDMPAAAERCRERASHYRQLGDCPLCGSPDRWAVMTDMVSKIIYWACSRCRHEWTENY